MKDKDLHMHEPNFSNVDYSNSILSIFDLGGFLHHYTSISHHTGLQQDLQNLRNDLSAIDNDYSKTSNRLHNEIKQVESDE